MKCCWAHRWGAPVAMGGELGEVRAVFANLAMAFNLLAMASTPS